MNCAKTWIHECAVHQKGRLSSIPLRYVTPTTVTIMNLDIFRFLAPSGAQEMQMSVCSMKVCLEPSNLHLSLSAQFQVSLRFQVSLVSLRLIRQTDGA